MKLQGPSLVCSLFKKTRISHLIHDVEWWKLKTWVQKKMVLKGMLFKIILLHVQGLHYREGIFDLEDHVGQKALSSDLLLKLGLIKKIPLASFPNHLLENIWIKSTFPYA
jgi:hypothetical protein